MITGSNIDPIRAEISKLENAQVFDLLGWERVLADLRAQGRTAGLADAGRRMMTAMGNQVPHVRTELGVPGHEIEMTLIVELKLPSVAMETEET